MRFLLLSDIHANSTALETSLAAVQDGWEHIVCLGDVVDYGPDPNEVLEHIRTLAPIGPERIARAFILLFNLEMFISIVNRPY